jgi:hypothetical protein
LNFGKLDAAQIKSMAFLVALLSLLLYQATAINLQETNRLPEAQGQATIQRFAGATQIEVTLDDMKPASLFGGDFNTYILWLILPDGRATNLGEFTLTGDHSTLRATSQLSDFDLMVTAEPHYLTSAPSHFVVLRTTDRPYIPYDGHYYFERDSLAGLQEAKGPVDTGFAQAYTAIRLAQRAGADPDELRPLWRLLRSGSPAKEIVRRAVSVQRAVEAGRALSGSVSKRGNL